MQAIGRGVRSTKDYCSIFLCDWRYDNKKYLDHQFKNKKVLDLKDLS